MNTMVPLKCLVSAAIVISSATYCRAEAPTVVAGTEDCLLGLNLGRSAKLSVRLSQLQKSQPQETAAIAAITSNVVGDDKANCEVPAATFPVTVDGILLQFPAGANAKLNCAKLLQTQITEGLKGIGASAEVPWNNGTAKPYDAAPQQNLAYMMFAAATSVGCGYTNNCEAGNNVVVCKFEPSLGSKFTEVPFTAKFYAALEARQAANVDISTLTNTDVNTDPSGASGGNGDPNNALSVVPAAGILVVSLLGLLSRP